MTIRQGYTIEQDDCFKVEPIMYDVLTDKPFPKPTNREESEALNKEMFMHPDEWFCADCGGRILFDIDKDGYVHKERRRVMIKV